MKLLLSDLAARDHGEAIAALSRRHGKPLELLTQSTCEQSPALAEGIDIGWYSRDIFMGGEPGRMSVATRQFFQHFDQARQPRWLQVMSAGTDMPLYQPSIKRGVMLTTASGVAAQPIAHTVIAALMGLSRGFPAWIDAQSRNEWRRTPDEQAPRDLPGQHAVIVGLGPIGLEVARLLRALGLRLTGIRRKAQDCPAVDLTLPYEAIDQVLSDCDWLILCCPLSGQTRGLISAQRLGRLPAHAHLLNVGRGPLLDEPALIAALQDRRLAGAYLDVFAREPLEGDSALWQLPNVWLSPHNSAASTGNRARDAGMFLDNLDRFLAGTALRNMAL